MRGHLVFIWQTWQEIRVLARSTTHVWRQLEYLARSMTQRKMFFTSTCIKHRPCLGVQVMLFRRRVIILEILKNLKKMSSGSKHDPFLGRMTHASGPKFYKGLKIRNLLVMFRKKRTALVW